MFDEFIREIRRISQPEAVRIDMPLDDKGYLDRTCPHNECGSDFKVLFTDWRDKVPDDAAVCPKCGGRSDPQTFNTSWQNDYIAQFAQTYMANKLNAALTRAARRTRPKQISAGVVGVQMSVSYKAKSVPIVLPPPAADALRQDLKCDDCDCTYSTIGAGYFCPACGKNSPLRDFERTILMARRVVERIGAIKVAVEGSHNSDIAADFEQQLLEDQVENLVTAFQRGTEALFRCLGNAGSFSPDANLFQRLNDSSNLWRLASGSGYDDILSPDEMETLKIMILRRHKIGHCQGMVDAKYVQQSGDPRYAVGQRLVTTERHVLELAAVMEKLLVGLNVLVT